MGSCGSGPALFREKRHVSPFCFVAVEKPSTKASSDCKTSKPDTVTSLVNLDKAASMVTPNMLAGYVTVGGHGSLPLQGNVSYKSQGVSCLHPATNSNSSIENVYLN